MSPPTRKSGRKWCGSSAPAPCLPSGGPGRTRRRSPASCRRSRPRWIGPLRREAESGARRRAPLEPAASTGMPSGTFWRSRSTPARCCPATTPITDSTTSPTSCPSRRRSSIATCPPPARSAGSRSDGHDDDRFGDLSAPEETAHQDDRMSEDLPFGSRGGVALPYHFPVDGEYAVRIKLQTNIYDYIQRTRQRPRSRRSTGRRAASSGSRSAVPSTAQPPPAGYAGSISGRCAMGIVRARGRRQPGSPISGQGRTAGGRHVIREAIVLRSRKACSSRVRSATAWRKTSGSTAVRVSAA